MIKRLFFAALLLLPGVAYAGNPSADLSVQVVDPPAGSGPAAPTPAVAAGFTTCVVCFDWTAASGGVYVNGAAVPGVNASQPNTWLDCAGASSPIWYSGANGGGPVGPCPTITTDSNGTQVLQMTIPSGTVITQGQWEKTGMEFVNANDNGIEVPTSNYMEATFEIPQFPYLCCGNAAYIMGPWLGTGDGTITTSRINWLELDAFEVNHDTYQGAFASGMGTWYGSGNGAWISSPNWYGTYPPSYNGSLITSQYVKVGQRSTTDGSSTIYKCMWINDVFQNCVNGSVNGTTFVSSQLSDATSRMQVYFSLASAAANGSTFTMPSAMLGWARSFNIWACPNWQTTACSTPGNPDPGGY